MPNCCKSVNTCREIGMCDWDITGRVCGLHMREDMACNSIFKKQQFLSVIQSDPSTDWQSESTMIIFLIMFHRWLSWFCIATVWPSWKGRRLEVYDIPLHHPSNVLMKAYLTTLYCICSFRESYVVNRLWWKEGSHKVDGEVVLQGIDLYCG